MKRFGLLVLLTLVGFIPVGCGSKASAPPTLPSPTTYTYNYLQQLGANNFVNIFAPFEQPPAGTYASPTGVVVSGNYVFVADSFTGYISRFELNGTFDFSFWASFAGGDCCNDPDSAPIGMAVDNHNHLFVCNSEYAEIDVYDLNGNWEFLIDPDDVLDTPTGVAVDANENVYVADREQGVFKFAIDLGSIDIWDCCPPQFEFGSIVSSNYDFDAAWGIAVNPGGNNVYVSDYEDNIVQVLDTGLNYKSTIGTSSTWSGGGAPPLTGQLYEPAGLTLDNDGNLLVCDTELYEPGELYGRIQKFAPNGTFLAEFGNNPDGDPLLNGQLAAPMNVTVDANRNVYVADWFWGSVFEYSNH